METLFFKPQTMKEALSLLAQYRQRALIINGGTDAVPSLVENKAATPDAIIYVSNLPGFHKVMTSEQYVRLNGGVTYREMLSNPLLMEYRGLYESILHLASPPIRAVATPAGNICTAAPSADCTTMLTALRAEVQLASVEGTRTVPLRDYFISTYKTVRRPEELVTAIDIPRQTAGDGTGYCRLSRRKAQDIGKVLVGAYVRMADGMVQDASISLGALNACVVHAAGLESMLIGKTAYEAVKLCASTFPEEAKLRESYFKAYKQNVVSAAVTRAVEMAVNSAKGADV